MLNSNELKELLENLKSFSQKSQKEQAELLAKWEFLSNDSRLQARHFGIEPDKELCEKMVTFSKDISLKSEGYLSLAQEYIDKYNKYKHYLSHREKRLYLEDAIGILLSLWVEAEKKKVKLPDIIYFTIAKAYLLRSQIYRPKGMTVPERKKEALRKALEWIQKVDFEKLSEAYLVKAEIYLELERIDEKLPDDAKVVFEQALNCKGEPDVIAEIAVHWAELKNDINATRNILHKKVLDPQDVSNLEKAKAAFLLRNGIQANQYLENLSDELKRCYFSNPLWDDAVYFLKELWDRGTNLWKDASIKLWKVCEEKVQTTSSLHIRWHWSRQRELYNLAFLAEKDIQKKAEIADSLKSLPPLKWKAWEEEAKTSDEFKKYLEQEEAALGKRYIKEIEYDKTPLPKKPFPLTSLPAPWIAIHFYLNHLERKGHALIYDTDKNKKKWEEKTFEFTPIFNAFEAWQTNYFEKKIGAANFLEKLCTEIGKQMPFLFELPEGRPVLFITHDFLHRLPLHAAIKNDELFLEKHPSMYLPAWGFVKTGNKQPGKDRILLKNFPYKFSKLVKMSWTSANLSARGKDLMDIKNPPELLVILCHGEADLVNPFSAKLHLAEGGITHREILDSKLYINNSIVILGACDTDLVPPIATSLDEHPSLNTAFLTKGARGVVGTLWKIEVKKMETFILRLDNLSARSSNVVYIIRDLQKEATEKWKQKRKPEVLYESMCFKAIGYPSLRNTP